MDITWRRRGQRPRPLLERFEEKIDKSGECWLWTGARTGHGYGVLEVSGRPRGAHRIAAEISLGRTLGRHELVCHHCDNPPCVRPDHLFLGDQSANMVDAVEKGRHNAGDRGPRTLARIGEGRRRWFAAHKGEDYESAKTHCPAGHAYDEANTIHIQGKRRCRACKQGRDRAAYARRQA